MARGWAAAGTAGQEKEVLDWVGWGREEVGTVARERGAAGTAAVG